MFDIDSLHAKRPMRPVDSAEASRGSGRTMSMVASLPEEGAVVVVHHSALKRYVEAMICDTRGSAVFAAMRVVVVASPADAKNALAGRSEPVIVDHAFWEIAPEPARVAVKALSGRGCAEIN